MRQVSTVWLDPTEFANIISHADMHAMYDTQKLYKIQNCQAWNMAKMIWRRSTDGEWPSITLGLIMHS